MVLGSPIDDCSKRDVFLLGCLGRACAVPAGIVCIQAVVATMGRSGRTRETWLTGVRTGGCSLAAISELVRGV